MTDSKPSATSYSKNPRDGCLESFERSVYEQPIWREVTDKDAFQLPTTWRDWLLDQGSLTARLENLCSGELAVNVLSQDWQLPFNSEDQMLALRPQETALVREVLLVCSGLPWVYARSVIPRQALEHAMHARYCLDDTPLGAWLFSEPSMTRGVIEIARVTGDYLGAFKQSKDSRRMWGRRSVFCVQNQPLLVTEIFLPSFSASDCQKTDRTL